MITYRFVTPEDTENILAIYQQYIDTSITFEYSLPSCEEFRERIEEIIQFYPYIAAVCDGRIVGYAYSHRAFERMAYQWDVEFSVYVDREYIGHGIGKELYHRLIELSRLQNIHTVYAKVTSPNEKSDALHRAVGFEKIAEFTKTGYKNGEWRSVTWYEMKLCEFETEPAAPISVYSLPSEDVRKILQ